MASSKQSLTATQTKELLQILQARFEKNPARHKGIQWKDVAARLAKQPVKCHSLFQMEATGGEPDVIGQTQSGEIIFADCSAESPAGRRSLCYDQAALDARKDFKPVHAAVERAAEMGIELMDESAYRNLQTLGKFDQKTSSWLLTPAAIRKAGGSIFGDYRYGQVFIYHNGAQSYYAARGFRGILRV